jgi:AraC-like DNA-binding protein
MFLHLHRPGPPLDRFVELVTYYEGFFPDHTKEKLLPDGAVEIIVDLTDTPKRLFDRDDPKHFTSFQDAWISGMRRGWIVIEAAPGASMAVIRFRPGGAFPFLGFDVDAITDTVDELDVVLGRATRELRERILEAPTLPAKMQAVEVWLLARGRGRLETNAVIEYLAGRLFAPAGIRISDVVSDIGYTQRHVAGLFRRWVGLSPKQYGRIRRFQQVLGTIAQRPAGGDPELADLMLRGRPVDEPDWADLALAHGYYDQSHLIREFRELSGFTPGQYVASFRGLENYLPLD